VRGQNAAMAQLINQTKIFPLFAGGMRTRRNCDSLLH
jgi:hypothetical protein